MVVGNKVLVNPASGNEFPAQLSRLLARHPPPTLGQRFAPHRDAPELVPANAIFLNECGDAGALRVHNASELWQQIDSAEKFLKARQVPLSPATFCPALPERLQSQSLQRHANHQRDECVLVLQTVREPMNDAYVREGFVALVQGQFRTGMVREELRHRTYRYEIEVAGFLERRGPVNVELGEWFEAGGARFGQLR